jgi:hypothetical protein
MDRSFLSGAELIKASRDFVCIRTATYEDKQEAEFLKWAFVGRSGGDLRNFGFCVLSPDGQKQLRRSTRGPNFTYQNSAAMAADLRSISRQYPAKATAGESTPIVPQMKNVRLGLNVASCDGLPSVIIVGKDLAEVGQLKKKLSGVIWDKELAGKFIYASTANPADLKIVPGAQSKTGFLVIKPDVFGLKGQLIQAIDAGVSSDDLRRSLSLAANAFTRNSKTHGLHVRNGRQGGKLWKTEVPVPARVRSPSRAPQGRRPR